MLIKELVNPPELEPTPKDIQDIQALIGTIDLQKEKPETLLNKLSGWIKQYPVLDKVTDIIPQTRLVKGIAAAIDALDAGDSKTALNALAGAVGGQLATVARAVNVGTALAQGDANQAALAAGGTIANVAKGVNAAQSLAQGDTQAAVSSISKGAGSAMKALAPKAEDVSFNGVTQHDNGDMTYSQGPITMRKNRDGSADTQATIGDTQARVQQNPIGVKTITAQGSGADAINSVDASAERKGVDANKFAQFKKQAAVSESAELTAMLRIAGLR